MISDKKRGSEVVINTTRYRSQLDDDKFPELANTYLCAPLVDESAGNEI